MVRMSTFDDNYVDRLHKNDTESFESLEQTFYTDDDMPFKLIQTNYDYMGASLFVTGLLTIYAIAILLFIISLIRKSRAELDIVDHLEDTEAVARASMKRHQRDSSPSRYDHSKPRVSIRRPSPCRESNLNSTDSEHSDAQDPWLLYGSDRRNSRHASQIVRYNSSRLLRKDPYKHRDKDFIIV